jgi:rifampicin phosphotransferase
MLFTLNDEVHKHIVGGKAFSLSTMKREKFNIPEGFILSYKGFANGKINNGLKEEFEFLTKKLLKKGNVAVRSSSVAEDGVLYSFAGEFDTVLNCDNTQTVLEAVKKVMNSWDSERASAYAESRGITVKPNVSVIVQLMVESDYSGVLFSADPVTGNYDAFQGNFIEGLGEDLVSGLTDAQTFSITRDTNKYTGAAALIKVGKKFFKEMHKLEALFRCPLDVEWAVKNNRLYILQARPISTLSGINPETMEINHSHTGNFIWTNTNLAEAIPDVMTPATWSVSRIFHTRTEWIDMAGVVPAIGNICGRPYFNLSIQISFLKALGKDYKDGFHSDFFGDIPEDFPTPFYPFRKRYILFQIFKSIPDIFGRIRFSKKELKPMLENNTGQCESIEKKIDSVENVQQLEALWKDEIFPLYNKICLLMRVATLLFLRFSSALEKKLEKYVSKDLIKTLLSNLEGDEELASLGMIHGLAKIAEGEMTKEEYKIKYGHRSPHELEISIPCPGEDEVMLQKLIDSSADIRISFQDLKEQKKDKFNNALEILQTKTGSKTKKIVKKLTQAGNRGKDRESSRSAYVRWTPLFRKFYLKAGKLTGLDNLVFFLEWEKLIEVLNGNPIDKKSLQLRSDLYEKQKKEPVLPGIIVGKFEFENWKNDPDRRQDIFTINKLPQESFDGDIKGIAASPGIVEGVVRIIQNTDETLKEGEILVTGTTNVGWTPLFLHARGIVTNIGAPLSHAAIVARELGIPAVVGCSNATNLLKTGDRIRLDGNNGVIRLLGEISKNE